MSNHLAIATVTAALRKRLQDAIDAAEPGVSGARVTSERPNAPATDLPAPGINVFLYQTTPNTTLRNHDTPTRSAVGTVVRSPRVALDLHYLLTFHGDDSRLEPQILHGIATRALHEHPGLTRAEIEAMLRDRTFLFLAGSDLASAADLPRFTPTALSIEEMSKLWSVFFQTPYVLSVSYQASVLVLESDTRPATALPVRSTRVAVRASTGPHIEAVLRRSAGGVPDDGPILAGSDVAIVGRDLLAVETRVRIDQLDVRPTQVGETQVAIRIPDTLRAGVHGLQVITARGGQSTPFDLASNLAAFVLQPAITVSRVGTTLRVGFSPPVARTQAVSLLLNELQAPAGRSPRAYRVKAPPPAADAPASATSLDIPIAGVEAGTYLVRAEVDGAQSALDVDPASGTYSQPQVTVS